MTLDAPEILSLPPDDEALREGMAMTPRDVFRWLADANAFTYRVLNGTPNDPHPPPPR